MPSDSASSSSWRLACETNFCAEEMVVIVNIPNSKFSHCKSASRTCGILVLFLIRDCQRSALGGTHVRCNEMRGVNYRQMVSKAVHKDLVHVRWNDVR